MTSVGPYAFVGTDVETTLRVGWALFDQLELGLSHDQLTIVRPHRLAAERMLDAVLVCEAEQDDALPVVWDEWRAAMADLRSAGAFGQPTAGTVACLFRSGGGVPKQ